MDTHRVGKAFHGSGSIIYLPTFLSRKALVEQSQDLGYIELDVLKVEVLLIVLLHL